MKARVIIGANYGDEGKGTVTATYTKYATGKVLNVLTNGGAQRGHSILTEDGSFTFQHFGSGTCFGADNYYPAFYILNPMQFVDEYDDLFERGVIQKVKLFRDKQCRWSTPYDMMANQILEHKRDKNKHGSCGMGIWETILRYQCTVTMDIDQFCALDTVDQKNYLKTIRDYFEKRIGTIPAEYKMAWYDEHTMDHFIRDCGFLRAKTNTLFDVANYDEIIFENGQGLLLNDTGFDVAGTTPSKTGVDYALQLMKTFGCDDVELHYVTRPYMTKHGRGGFELEAERRVVSTYVNEDRTNHYNRFQENFRYGMLDIEDLHDRIQNDAKKLDNQLRYTYKLEVTHCDEMDRLAEFGKHFQNINSYDCALIK